MLDITGAGAQLPMRSHGKLRPGPQSHKNSEQQCKRYRARHTHSKQQSKRYKASGPATATCAPVPPQAHTRAPGRPECHSCHRRLTWKARAYAVSTMFTSSSMPRHARPRIAGPCACCCAPLGKSGGFRGGRRASAATYAVVASATSSSGDSNSDRKWRLP